VDEAAFCDGNATMVAYRAESELALEIIIIIIIIICFYNSSVHHCKLI